MSESLPTIRLEVSGDVFKAGGHTEDGIQWSIYAEAESSRAAMTRVFVDDKRVAKITVHPLDGETLPKAAQTIGAALVWSAIRAVRLRRQEAAA